MNRSLSPPRYKAAVAAIKIVQFCFLFSKEVIFHLVSFITLIHKYDWNILCLLNSSFCFLKYQAASASLVSLSFSNK